MSKVKQGFTPSKEHTSTSYKKAVKYIYTKNKEEWDLALFPVLSYAFFLLGLLAIVLLISGCSGWSVMGYDMEGVDLNNFDEIVSADSTTHYFRNVREGQNWCFYHAQYELVEIK